MSRIVSEQILGDLLQDGKIVYQGIRLDIRVNEMFVDERAMPTARAIMPGSMKLSPMSQKAVQDGTYILRRTFDGKTEEDRVRVRDGWLLAG
jgi:hypothetical protein